MNADFHALIPALPDPARPGERRLDHPPAHHPDASALWSRARIPERQRNTAADFSRQPWGATAGRLLARFTERPDSMVAVIGPRGTGKTQAAVEVLRAAARRGISCRYVTAFDFFASVRATYSGNESELSVLRGFTDPGVLCVDEIQVRSESTWENNLLTHTIDQRYGTLRATLLVSNLDRPSFAASVGDSITSRLMETGGFIAFDGPSFRAGGA